MNAIILSIGDELVLGQTIDTNSAWLSQQLAAVGCGIREHLTVPDQQPAIEGAIRNAIAGCDVLLVSGGIGPTEDDLTRQSLARVLNQPLELNDLWLQELHKFFRARGREMPEMNKIQAMIPRGTELIFNHCGTAAGIHAKVRRLPFIHDSAAEHGLRASIDPDYDPLTDIFVMPGVPKEMKAMFLRDVLPHIQEKADGAVILSRTLHTFGLGESAVAELLGDLMRRDRNPSVGTTVSHGVVSLRVNARFPSRAMAQEALDQTVKACRAALGDLIYGEDEQSLQDVVARMLIERNTKLAKENKTFTITTAESCTGGLLSAMLTDISGSSAYFREGFVTYANQAKRDLLGVPQAMLDAHGAVSEQVVTAMAAGARQCAGANVALAISGIAGPTGGTPDKPVGTVWIALASDAGVSARRFLFAGDREMIRDRSAKMALTMLRFHLLDKPTPF